MKTLEYPELRQIHNFDCGASALTSVLAYYGIDRREDEIWKMADITKQGIDASGILHVLDHFGLEHVAYTGMTPVRLRQAIVKQEPTIIALQAWNKNPKKDYSDSWNDGHFVVAIGFDGFDIIFDDPSSYKRTFLSDPELMKRWHGVGSDKIKLEQWGVIVSGTPKFRAGAMEHMG